MCYGFAMMIRSLTVSLLFAVLAAPAYAQDSTPEPQDNPQTRQTDESEDDYRRSQRRRDTGDIFDDIDINTSGSGSGGLIGPEVKAIDRLDQESRRHLNKQRAKALAEAGPGEPIDAAYEPSETAKTDDYVAEQEKEAWEEMLREANGGIGIIQGPKGGSGQGGGQGSSGQGQSGQTGQGGGQGQAGGQSGQEQSGQRSTPSVIRGGSASSASAILDQLKGRSSGVGQGTQGSQGSQQGQGTQGQDSQGQGTQGQGINSGQSQGQSGNQSGSQSGQGQQSGSPSGQSESTQRGGSSSSASSIFNQIKGLGGSGSSPQGQSPQGQSSQGQGQNGSQGDSQSQSQAQNQSQNQGQSSQTGQDQSQQGQSSAQGQSQSEAQSQAQSASSAASNAAAQAQSAAGGGVSESAENAAAEAAAHHDETMSPLERLKRDPIERDTAGGRTSASDYLNRGK